jgi:hypothetical protein
MSIEEKISEVKDSFAVRLNGLRLNERIYVNAVRPAPWEDVSFYYLEVPRYRCFESASQAVEQYLLSVAQEDTPDSALYDNGRLMDNLCYIHSIESQRTIALFPPKEKQHFGEFMEKVFRKLDSEVNVYFRERNYSL